MEENGDPHDIVAVAEELLVTLPLNPEELLRLLSNMQKSSGGYRSFTLWLNLPKLSLSNTCSIPQLKIKVFPAEPPGRIWKI